MHVLVIKLISQDNKNDLRLSKNDLKITYSTRT